MRHKSPGGVVQLAPARPIRCEPLAVEIAQKNRRMVSERQSRIEVYRIVESLAGTLDAPELLAELMDCAMRRDARLDEEKRHSGRPHSPSASTRGSKTSPGRPRSGGATRDYPINLKRRSKS